MSLVELSGSAFQRGLAQGDAAPRAAVEVRGMVRQRLADEAQLLSGARARDFLEAQWAFTARHANDHLQEVIGIAQGFGLPARDLFAYLHLGFMAPLRQALDGCSTVALAASADGPMIAKNRDYRGEHQALQRVFLQRDPEKPNVSCIFVGSLGAPGAYSSGMNSHGLALADTRVDWPEPGVGWLRYFLMSEILWRAEDVPQALALIGEAAHVGGGSLALADAAGRVASVEFGSEGAVARTGAAQYVHTNHFLAPELAGVVERLAPDNTSQSSIARLQSLSAAEVGFGPDTTAEDLCALLASHGEGEGRLCRHPSAGLDSTISGAVFLCRSRTLLFAAGTPCDAGWQRFCLQGAGGGT
ncbi:C45 family peptidase [Ovoidimarina sediminis]|uniref:C45 family peptidase n=1 Tax=Ovoidimarina sediminis TaxID=3079856 RepID=UPI002912AF2D|nr:C45 family peptidase [Rhodophyticola sp. MJ-SS7]MDU8941818.1 C45 family peptidase [Rhodophyticola sp. MJ-SS7]